MDSLPDGTVLQKGLFAIDRVLGQGGFGITYQATDTRLNRPTAIKEFFPFGCTRQGPDVHPNGALSPTEYTTAKQKFIEEAQVLAALYQRFHHPGIVQVYTFFEENNTAYLVMEYLKGETLAHVLERQEKLSILDAIAAIERVGEALAQVHQANLVHRDIKPDNIMLCDNDRVVLIDFGLAKQEVGNRYGTRRLTGTSALGTDGYAPIEQYSRLTEFKPTLDIHALGATLYHLLSGSVPPSAVERAGGEVLLPLRDVNPLVSQTINDATLWAMELQAPRRPQTVGDFLGALRKSYSPTGKSGVGNTLITRSSQQVAEARARAQENIVQWQKALDVVREAEQVAEHPVPLPARLVDGVSEALRELQTTAWLTIVGIEKEAASARTEVLATAQQIIGQERQVRLTAESSARGTASQAQQSIDQAKARCQQRIDRAQSDMSNAVEKAKWERPRVDKIEWGTAIWHGLCLTAGAWTIGAIIFICLGAWAQSSKNPLLELLFNIFALIMAVCCYGGWALVPGFHLVVQAVQTKKADEAVRIRTQAAREMCQKEMADATAECQRTIDPLKQVLPDAELRREQAVTQRNKADDALVILNS